MKLYEILPHTKPAFPVLLQRNCQLYLSAINYDINKNVIYRGMRTAKNGQKIQCPVNRSPKDTPKEVHKVADDWFLEKFGIRYRSNSVFGTGEGNSAAEYGKVYAIFPIGKFSYCWSSYVEDFTGAIGKKMKQDWLGGARVELPDDYEHLTTEFLEYNEYVQNKDLIKAIKSGNEIMIHCSEYYVCSVDEDGELIDLETEVKKLK